MDNEIFDVECVCAFDYLLPGRDHHFHKCGSGGHHLFLDHMVRQECRRPCAQRVLEDDLLSCGAQSCTKERMQQLSGWSAVSFRSGRGPVALSLEGIGWEDDASARIRLVEAAP